MNVSWHLLFEQLLRNPELLEETADKDLNALQPDSQADLDPSDREILGIAQLQQRLGNRGLHQLIRKHGAKINRQATLRRVTDEKDSETTPQSVGQAVSEVSQDAKTGPDQQHPDPPPAVPATAQERNLIAAEDDLETTVAAEPGKDESVSEKTSADSKPGKEPAPARRLAKLLPIFIASLPQPPLETWKALIDIYPQLQATQQTTVINMLIRRVQALPPAAQHRFTLTLRDLPGALSKTGLVSALSVRLLRHGKVNAAPVASPPAEE